MPSKELPNILVVDDDQLALFKHLNELECYQANPEITSNEEDSKVHNRRKEEPKQPQKLTLQ